MGSPAQTILAVVLLAAVSCGRDTESEQPLSPDDNSFVRTRASSFEWIRSKKDTESSSLRTQWKLTGSEASEILEQENSILINIRSPFIEHFSSSRMGTRRVTVISPRGTFREQDGEILFSPGTLVQVFNRHENPHICMVTADLHYSTEEDTLRSPDTVSIRAEKSRLTGKGVRYDLNTNVCRIISHTCIEFEKSCTRPHIESLPPFAEEDVYLFLRSRSYIHDSRKGLHTFTVSSTGKGVYDFGTHTIMLNGPVKFDSAALFLRADTMQISASDSSLYVSSEPRLKTVYAHGNIRFREKKGEKRRVRCSRLRYDLGKDTVVMTGNPVMKGTSTHISSARITYHPRSASFKFAKPFRIERTPEPGEEN